VVTMAPAAGSSESCGTAVRLAAVDGPAVSAVERLTSCASSWFQDLSFQHAALAAVGCTVIRSEKVTSTSTEGREELATPLQFVREGGTLVVTRIDRLARSLRDLQNIVCTKESPRRARG